MNPDRLRRVMHPVTFECLASVCVVFLLHCFSQDLARSTSAACAWLAVVCGALLALGLAVLASLHCIDSAWTTLRLSAAGWTLQGKRVKVVGWGVDLKLLSTSMAAAVPEGATVVGSGPADVLVIVARQKRNTDLSENVMGHASQVIDTGNQVRQELLDFVSASKKHEPKAVVVVIEGWAALSGNAGQAASIFAWSLYGFAEGIRPELQQTHPKLRLSTFIGMPAHLQHPSHAAAFSEALVSAVAAHPRKYYRFIDSFARALHILPLSLQRRLLGFA